MTQTAIEALAEAWASIDGKLAQYEADKLEGTDGHYAGYTAEAKEMITRLEKRGFTVSALSALHAKAGVSVEDETEETYQKLETIVAPDNATVEEVLKAIQECALAWVPEARIIGNVRAGDIARAVRSALSTKLQEPVGSHEYELHDASGIKVCKNCGRSQSKSNDAKGCAATEEAIVAALKTEGQQ